MDYIKNIALEYLHSNINMHLTEGINLNFITSFFESHFTITEDKVLDEVMADIYFNKEKFEDPDICFEDGESVYIRKSAVDFFTSPAKRCVKDGKEYIFAEKSKTVMVLDSKEKKIYIHLSDGGYELEIIELLRDIVLKNEENHGVMVLHATCGYKQGMATLVMGTKGAGKSTILFELVNKFDYKFMSGDKTLVHIEDGKLVVTGWPDYPHLGIGMLLKYPELIRKLNVEEQIGETKDNWSSTRKLAVDPLLFNKVIPMVSLGTDCEVKQILYPEVKQADDCRLVPFEEHVTELVNNIESIYGEKKVYWNNFITKSDVAGSLDKHYFTMLKGKKGYSILGNGYMDDKEEFALL